jgi:Xaa-Pro aminopeptidase
MKRVKDEDEIELLRRSMRAGDAGHAAALRDVRPGMTELEMYLLVQNACLLEAGEQAIVYGDFVSGPRCVEHGGPPTQRVIEQGDPVLVDFSVVIGGYRGDFANTFICGFKPTSEQMRLYDACLDALRVGETMARAGTPCRDVDAEVRACFANRQLGPTFNTHTGHGLGLGHPDPPYLVPESTDTLVAGDVIAIEPGQYVPGVAGLRYEHNYLVTDSDPVRLSNHELSIRQPS